MVSGLEILALACLACRREDGGGWAASLQEGLAGGSGVHLLRGCQRQASDQ